MADCVRVSSESNPKPSSRRRHHSLSDREGRGLGLANRMRTYQLQDDGLETFDANTTLGFDEMSAITASPHACSGC
jgi:hypothetical protein